MEKKQITHSDIPPLLIPHYTEGALSLVPISPEAAPIWPALNDFFEKQKVQMPFMFSRPEFQLETLFYYVCREHNIPSAAGSVYTLPVTLEIIKELKPDVLVSQPELAEILLNTMNKKGLPIPFTAVFLFPDTGKVLLEKVRTLAPKVVVIASKHPLDV